MRKIFYLYELIYIKDIIYIIYIFNNEMPIEHKEKTPFTERKNFVTS